MKDGGEGEFYESFGQENFNWFFDPDQCVVDVPQDHPPVYVSQEGGAPSEI